MFKNFFIPISSKQLLINRIPLFKYHFTTTNPKKPLPQPNLTQDWEYIQRISLQIKNNNPNDALRYLIQSHLHDHILNKQIYYSLQQQFLQMKMDNGYHQILYLLYREKFVSNSQMLNWMKKISKSNNTKIIEQLKKDFQLLGQIYPDINSIISQNEIKIQNNQNTKQVKHGRKIVKIPTSQTTDEYFSKTPSQITSKKQKSTHINANKQRNDDKSNKNSAAQLQGHQLQQQFQNLIEHMFKQHGKLTLHNVQLTFNDNEQFNIEEMNQMYGEQNTEVYYDENNQEYQNLEGEFLQFLSSISKIKVQRIEFTTNSSNDASTSNDLLSFDKNNDKKKH